MSPTSTTLSSFLRKDNSMPAYARPLYDAVLTHAELLDDHPFEIDLSDTFPEDLDLDQIKIRAAELFLYPGCFLWTEPIPYAPLSSTWTAVDNTTDDLSLWTLHLNFAKSKEEIIRSREEIKQVISQIIEEIPEGVTDFEKVTFFFEWISSNVKVGIEPKTLEEADSLVDMRYSKGAFLDKTATCVGFAHAMRELCEAADIACSVISASTAMSQEQIAMEAYQKEKNGNVKEVLRSKSENIRRAESAAGEHALCLIEIDDKLFFTDPMKGSSLVKQFGSEAKTWHIGLAMDTQTLECLGAVPKAFDGSVIEIAENDLSDYSRSGIVHVKQNSYNRSEITEHIAKRVSEGKVALFTFDDVCDRDLLLDNEEQKEIALEISESGIFTGAFAVYGDDSTKHCLVKSR